MRQSFIITFVSLVATLGCAVDVEDPGELQEESHAVVPSDDGTPPGGWPVEERKPVTWNLAEILETAKIVIASREKAAPLPEDK